MADGDNKRGELAPPTERRGMLSMPMGALQSMLGPMLGGVVAPMVEDLVATLTREVAAHGEREAERLELLRKHVELMQELVNNVYGLRECLCSKGLAKKTAPAPSPKRKAKK